MTIICEICNKHFKAITNTHLKSHNISLEQYKEIYPSALLISETLHHQMSESAKKSNEQFKGIPRSKETKERISKALIGKEAWNKGISTSIEVREKISNSVKADYASGKRTHWNTGNNLSQDTKDKISDALIGIPLLDQTKQKLKILMSARINDPSYIAPMKNKVHSAKTKLLISEKSKASLLKKRHERYEQYIILCKENDISLLEQYDKNCFNLQCDICNSQFTRTVNVFYKSKNHFKNLCPVCNPTKSISDLEIELKLYIKSVYIGLMIDNDTTILHGKEIDILIPDLNIGFEFDGVYWHSSFRNDNPNHLLWKTKLAATKGISLYHIFEDEWVNKKEIVKSRIRHILRINFDRIHARKCIIQKISNVEKNSFLSTYHLQGSDISGIRYGAYHNNQLVAVMTFTKTSFVKGGDGLSYELNRFAVIKDVTIPGIASKLLKTFMNEYAPERLISYADRRWSNGNVYKQLGFKFVEETPISHWYFKGTCDRIHRSVFMKHKQEKLLKTYDATLTEKENMLNNGYGIIYDCGTTKWEYIKKEIN